MSNDIDLFTHLGNVFPNYRDLQDCLSKLPIRTKQLLGNISNGDLEDNVSEISIGFITQYLSKSYSKKVSSFIDLLLLNDGLTIKNDYYVLSNSYDTISNLIDGRYYNKWLKLWNTYKLKYDAIKPYEMSITENVNEVINNDLEINRNTNNNTNISNSENITSSKENTNQENNSETKTLTNNENSSSSTKGNSTDNVINNETEDSIYGFNSNNAVNTDKSINNSESNSDSQENSNYNSETSKNENNSLTRTSSNQENDTSSKTFENEETNVYSGKTTSEQDKTTTNDRTVNRLGNIGNITQQELIEKEREVWLYQIYDVIFSDLDKIFTCGCY